MATRIGGALTPVLVVPLLSVVGWRMTFVMFGLVGLAWAAIWHAWYRDHPREKASVSSEELAEIEVNNETKLQTPMAWRQMLAKPNLWWIMLMYFTYCWSGYFYQSWLFNFLQNGRNYSKADLISFSWLPFVFGGCANLLGGIAGDMAVRRYGLILGRRLVGIGGLSISALFIVLAMLTADKVLTIVFLALAYAGSDFMLPVAWAVCLDIGGRHAGAISGAMNMAGQAGAVCSSVAFGYIVAKYGSYDTPLIPMAVMTAIAALIWLKIKPHQPIDA